MPILSRLTLAVALALPLAAVATPISGVGLPTDAGALSGGTVVDFESTGNFSGASLSVGGVTFTGNGPVQVSNDYAGQYNTRGTYHITNFGSAPNQYQFSFSSAVSAFAFLWGAADVSWTLTAFNAANQVLDSVVINPTFSGNAGNYFGIASDGIVRATLIGGYGDYVFIDNFTYKTASTNDVPEPGVLSLLAVALAGAGLVARRRRA